MDANEPNPVWTMRAMRVAVLRRSAKTVKGGRRFSYGVLVVVGDASGYVGLGWGKSREVAAAIQKAERAAVAEKVRVPLKAGRISHEVTGQYCGAKVLLRPAPPGTGIIAGKVVRDVLQCAGVKDVVAKSMGARNPANVAKATIQALLALRLKARKARYPILKLPDLNAGNDPLRLN